MYSPLYLLAYLHVQISTRHPIYFFSYQLSYLLVRLLTPTRFKTCFMRRV